MSNGFRVRILCEDRLTERFLRKLCERFGVHVLDVVIHPGPRGAASAWVSAQYPRLVQLRRSKKHQQNLGLLVHIDGDNVGLQARKVELDAKLCAFVPQLDRRRPNEPVAVFVPTWCIETWLLHLAGIAQPPETEKLKRGCVPDPAYRPALNELKADERSAIEKASRAWPGTSSSSLQDAATEARRIHIP